MAYRSDSDDSNVAGRETTAMYGSWIGELLGLLRPNSRVLDLGCGAGVPASRALIAAGFDVTGVDISSVQIERARVLVPGATFVCSDMVTWDCPPGSFDAVVSFYALIHVPLEDQRQIIPRMARWLRTGGIVMAIVGSERWSGVDDYLGSPMFWDQADIATYLSWLRDAGLEPVWHRYIPEGASGHTLTLARRR